MRRKNLMRLTAAMGMMMACSQVRQAAAPVWGNETVEETTAGSHDDLIEIPTLEDEEYPGSGKAKLCLYDCAGR